MSNVALSIAGRSYSVACSPGEEAHLAALGQMIEARLAAMPNIAGQPEGRRFLYAALLLADELHEQQQRQEQQEAPRPEIADALEALADRLEALAAELEAQDG